MSPLDRVRQREDHIRTDRFETGFAVDTTGQVLLDKPGRLSEIEFTDDEIARLKEGTGVIFTHNHPGGWKFSPDDPRRGGASFSPDDIHLACKCALTEMRVVTPRFRFSMLPPVGGWDEDYWLSTVKPNTVRLVIKLGRIPCGGTP